MMNNYRLLLLLLLLIIDKSDYSLEIHRIAIIFGNNIYLPLINNYNFFLFYRNTVARTHIHTYIYVYV
jgi:hypothetical protein